MLWRATAEAADRIVDEPARFVGRPKVVNLDGISVLLILALVWILLGLAAAIALGRMVRRSNEENDLFGSLHAPPPQNRPRPRMNRSVTDRDGRAPPDTGDQDAL